MAKHHKIKYYEEVPKITDLRDMLEKSKAAAADRVAFRYTENKQDRQKTYTEFYEDVYSLGTALAKSGFGAAHTACVANNRYEWIVTYLSALCGAGVFVGVDKELTESGMLNVIERSDSEIVFCSEKYEKILAENRGAIPKVKKIVCFDRETDEGDLLSYKKFIEEGRAAYLDGARDYTDLERNVEDMRSLVFTSGTTGVSKGVMLSEKNLASMVYYGLRVSTVYERGLSVLPYHHTYEGVVGLLVYIHMRSTTCINESLRTIAPNLKKYKPIHIYMVPALADALYKNVWKQAEKSGKAGALKELIKISNALRKIGIDLRKRLFKSVLDGFGGELKKIVCGGAPVTPEVGDFFDAIGISLVNGYGITECSPLVAVNQDDFNDCRTVGVPVECVDIDIFEPDESGNGEICVRGDTVMMGYYKDPDATAKALVDGWFHTGDFGHINNLGQLVITGRKKNIIVLKNGKNIYPEEIESMINPIPYVIESVVSQLGEDALCAEVFCDAEMLKEMGIGDVLPRLKSDIDAALAEFPPYKQIAEIKLRTEPFPKNSSNKILRENYGK